MMAMAKWFHTRGTHVVHDLHLSTVTIETEFFRDLRRRGRDVLETQQGNTWQ